MISAVILVAVVLVVGWKLMSFLDRRYERKKRSEKNSEAVGAGEDEELK